MNKYINTKICYTMTIIENDYWVIDQTSEALSGFIGYLCI